MRSAFIITTDGPAGAGKSTVADLLAKRLGLRYLDTGATYRALAYEALRQGIDPAEESRIARLARSLRLTIRHSKARGLHLFLDGHDVTRRLRSERVTDAAAQVAQHSRVRLALVRLQRRLARADRLVIEGRDTGSVVFPHAPYKFFLIANASVRAKRRQSELRQLQGRAPSLKALTADLKERDQLDLRRHMGPLVKPARAIVLDTSRLPVQQVVARMLHYLPAA